MSQPRIADSSLATLSQHTWVLLVMLIFCATKVQHGRVKYESVTVSFLPRRMLASSDDLSDVIRIKLGIHFKEDIHSSVPGQPGTANRLSGIDLLEIIEEFVSDQKSELYKDYKYDVKARLEY